jgi:hypothetical protein
MVDKAMDQGLGVNRERLALRLDWRGDHSKFIANHPYRRDVRIIYKDLHLTPGFYRLLLRDRSVSSSAVKLRERFRLECRHFFISE